ncbi:ATPase involved in DNA replication (DNA polymerase III delta\' subunit) [gamma proteobacterium HdN1]|nr:ATPase involved in DNA replication (DNA polymerase III delta\' subunit) [gamma proteobacterium HdN1]
MNSFSPDEATTRACLPWQVSQWKHLTGAFRNGKLPHALLLQGQSGVGKELFARGFAQRLLCTAPRSTQSPQSEQACGQCRNCHLFVADTHPDFFCLSPEEGSKSIRVEQVRELIAFAGKKAQLGGYRVVILKPADAMNVNSANALLKCLEEPGKDTVIMLLTDQPGRLLATVRSRCQSVVFPIPEALLSEPWLASKLGVNGQARASTLLELSGGRPLRALALEGSAWITERDRCFDVWRSYISRQTQLVAAADALSKLPLNDVIEWLYGWYVDLAKLQLYADFIEVDRRESDRNEADRSQGDKIDLLRPFARQFASAQIFSAHDRLLALRGIVLRGGNLNPQMAIEGLLLSLRP